MYKKRILGAIATATALILALGGCAAGSTGSTDSASKELVIAANVDNRTFDPKDVSSTTGQIVQYWQPVYDTLLVRTPDGGVGPNMADYKYNDDRTVLTLTLRDDLKFADGSPITSDAVIKSIDRFREGTLSDVQQIEGWKFEAVDDTTLKITLPAVDPAAIYRLTTAPGAIANPAGFDGDIAAVPAASGPYVLDEAETRLGDQFVYTRNPNYWNPSAFPYDKLTIKLITDTTARANALKSGQVDVAIIDPQAIDEMESSGLKVYLHKSAWEGLHLFDKNGELVPALADVRVRQAMNMALDRDSIAHDLLHDTVTANSQIFQKDSPAYYDGSGENYTDGQWNYDVDAAKKLMADAGYADGFDLVVPTIPGSPASLLDPTMVQSLGEIGIRVTLETLPAEQAGTAIPAKKYAVASLRQTQDTPWIDFQRALPTYSGVNPFQIATPELDALLEADRLATDEERPAADKAVGKYLFEQAWFLPWYDASQVMGYSPDVSILPQVGINVMPIRNYSPAN